MTSPLTASPAERQLTISSTGHVHLVSKRVQLRMLDMGTTALLLWNAQSPWSLPQRPIVHDILHRPQMQGLSSETETQVNGYYP
jgi:hypothetical protein